MSEEQFTVMTKIAGDKLTRVDYIHIRKDAYEALIAALSKINYHLGGDLSKEIDIIKGKNDE